MNKMNRIIKRNIRNKEIAEKTLVFGATLQSVGDIYGLSRERVRQIVNIVLGTNKRTAIKVKNDIKLKLFKCITCGKEISSNNTYCSRKCRDVYQYFDWKSPLNCKCCGKQYYPQRNWKNTNSFVGKYCSMKCYSDNRLGDNKLSSNFKNKIIKSLEKP